MHRLGTALVGSAVLLALFALLTYLFIPDRVLQGIVARGLAQEGFTFTAARLGKAFPLGVTAKRVEIGNESGPLLKADEATIRIALLPILRGKLEMDYRLRIGTGELFGSYFPGGNGNSTFETRDVKLEEIPFFPTVTGAKVKGDLSGHGSLAGRQATASGELQLEARKTDLSGMKIGDTPLPDAAYDSARISLKVSSGKILLESFTLQGEGLYVRLKGDLPLTSPLSAAPLNLTLELMPKPDFLDRQKFVFLLLTKFQASPGHFQIPIKGTLGKPAIQ